EKRLVDGVKPEVTLRRGDQPEDRVSDGVVDRRQLLLTLAKLVAGLLELQVRSRELIERLCNLMLRPISIGDIAHERRVLRLVVPLDRRHRKLDREFVPVAMKRRDLDAPVQKRP